MIPLVDLPYLVKNWGDAYDFAITDGGAWVAIPLNHPERVLAATTAEDLRLQVRADCQHQAVPRPPEGGRSRRRKEQP